MSFFGLGYVGEDCKAASIGHVALLSMTGKTVKIKAHEDESKFTCFCRF